MVHSSSLGQHNQVNTTYFSCCHSYLEHNNRAALGGTEHSINNTIRSLKTYIKAEYIRPPSLNSYTSLKASTIYICSNVTNTSTNPGCHLCFQNTIETCLHLSTFILLPAPPRPLKNNDKDNRNIFHINTSCIPSQNLPSSNSESTMSFFFSSQIT